MIKAQTPFLVVNPKSYLYGEKSLELAKAADKVAKETGIQIYFTCPFADIRYIKENTENMTVFLTTHYMEEAANAGYVVILDKGSVVAEGTPFELKNDYVQDIVSVYGISEDEIKSLNREYKKIRDGYQIKVRNTKEATKLIVEHQDLFTDYEVVKGGMDDVFLAVTGKKLGGEH